jgi:hypothetical protein
VHCEPITVSFECYELAEFRGWCDENSDVLDKMLALTGPLCRGACAIRRQRDVGMHHNYTEVK